MPLELDFEPCKILVWSYTVWIAQILGQFGLLFSVCLKHTVYFEGCNSRHWHKRSKTVVAYDIHFPSFGRVESILESSLSNTKPAQILDGTSQLGTDNPGHHH